jgi:hypothetical protein
MREIAARFGVNCGHGYDEAASRGLGSSAVDKPGNIEPLKEG